MKGYSKSGTVITFTAPAGGVLSGVPILIGSLVVVPQASAAQGLPFEGVTSGEFTGVPKAAGAWTEGALLYWDSAASNFATAQSATARRAAVATKAAQGADTTGTVYLFGVGSVANVA